MGKYDRSLAQFFSTKRELRPFASGSARKVYYSPKHQVVFKVLKDPEWAKQHEKEAAFFQSLSKRERQYLAIREVVEYQGQIVIVMDMAQVDWSAHFYVYYNTHSQSEIARAILEYGASKKVKVSNAVGAARFIKKYQLCDLDYRNVGLIGDRFVIVDAGISRTTF